MIIHIIFVTHAATANKPGQKHPMAGLTKAKGDIASTEVRHIPIVKATSFASNCRCL